MAMETPGMERLEQRELLRVLTALGDGDFTHLLPEGLDGIDGQIAATVNTLIRRLNVFASEVTRISREIGVEGKFGGQAEVAGISGTWRDLVANVNVMGANLTDQIRDISRVTWGLTQGDASRRVTVEAQGETLLLKELLNTLVEQANAR